MKRLIVVLGLSGILVSCNDKGPTAPTVTTAPSEEFSPEPEAATSQGEALFYDGNRFDGRLCHWGKRKKKFVQKEGLTRANYDRHLSQHRRDFQGYCPETTPELFPLCHFNRIKDAQFEFETRMVSEDQMEWHLSRHHGRTDPSLPNDYRGECESECEPVNPNHDDDCVWDDELCDWVCDDDECEEPPRGVGQVDCDWDPDICDFVCDDECEEPQGGIGEQDCWWDPDLCEIVCDEDDDSSSDDDSSDSSSSDDS